MIRRRKKLPRTKQGKGEDEIQSTLLKLRQEGKDAQKILDTIEELAHFRLENEKHESAETLFRESFLSRTYLLGPRHRKTLEAQFYLGNSLFYLTRYTECEILYRGAAEGSEKAFGAQDIDTMEYRQGQAESLIKMERHKEAEILCRQTWELRKRVLGEEHSATLRSQCQLAWTLADLKRYSEAETLYRQTWELRKRVLGEEHPATLRSRYHLAWTLAGLERYSEAETLYRQTWKTRQRLFGNDHVKTLLSLNGLSSTLFCLGKYDLALARIESGLSSTVVLRNHGYIRHEMYMLGHTAKCLFEVGHVQEARDMFYDVLQRDEVETDPGYRAHMELCLAVASVDGSSVSTNLILDADVASGGTWDITYGKQMLAIIRKITEDRDHTSRLEHNEVPFQRSIGSYNTDTASATFLHGLVHRENPTSPSIDTEISTIREMLKTDRVPTVLELDFYFAKPTHANFMTRDAHLDTKASANYVSSVLVEQLGHTTDAFEGGEITTAAGTITPIGQVSLVFEWQGSRKLRKRRFLIVEDLAFDVILGIGFITEFGVYSIGSHCLLVMALSPLKKEEKEKLKITAAQNRQRRDAEEKLEEERNRTKRQEKAMVKQTSQGAKPGGSKVRQT